MADNQGGKCPKCNYPCEPNDEECEDCGYPFDRPKILTQCPIPDCMKPRNKNKRDIYKKYCGCGYEFEDKAFTPFKLSSTSSLLSGFTTTSSGSSSILSACTTSAPTSLDSTPSLDSGSAGLPGLLSLNEGNKKHSLSKVRSVPESPGLSPIQSAPEGHEFRRQKETRRVARNRRVAESQSDLHSADQISSPLAANISHSPTVEIPVGDPNVETYPTGVVAQEKLPSIDNPPLGSPLFREGSDSEDFFDIKRNAAQGRSLPSEQGSSLTQTFHPAGDSDPFSGQSGARSQNSRSISQHGSASFSIENQHNITHKILSKSPSSSAEYSKPIEFGVPSIIAPGSSASGSFDKFLSPVESQAVSNTSAAGNPRFDRRGRDANVSNFSMTEDGKPIAATRRAPAQSPALSPYVSPAVSTDVSPAVSPYVSAGVPTDVTPALSPYVSAGVPTDVTPVLSPYVSAGAPTDMTPPLSPYVSAGVPTDVTPALSTDMSPAVSLHVSPAPSTDVSSAVSTNVSHAQSPAVPLHVSPVPSLDVSHAASTNVPPVASPAVTMSLGPPNTYGSSSIEYEDILEAWEMFMQLRGCIINFPESSNYMEDNHEEVEALYREAEQLYTRLQGTINGLGSGSSVDPLTENEMLIYHLLTEFNDKYTGFIENPITYDDSSSYFDAVSKEDFSSYDSMRYETSQTRSKQRTKNIEDEFEKNCAILAELEIDNSFLNGDDYREMEGILYDLEKICKRDDEKDDNEEGLRISSDLDKLFSVKDLPDFNVKTKKWFNEKYRSTFKDLQEKISLEKKPPLYEKKSTEVSALSLDPKLPIEFNVVCSSNARGIDGDVEIEIENSSNLRMTKRDPSLVWKASYYVDKKHSAKKHLLYRYILSKPNIPEILARRYRSLEITGENKQVVYDGVAIFKLPDDEEQLDVGEEIVEAFWLLRPHWPDYIRESKEHTVETLYSWIMSMSRQLCDSSRLYSIRESTAEIEHKINEGLYEQLVDYIEKHQSCQWNSSVEILASLIGLIHLNRMFSQDFSTTAPADAMDGMIVKSFEHVSELRVTEENFMSNLETCCGGDEKWRSDLLSSLLAHIADNEERDSSVLLIPLVYILNSTIRPQHRFPAHFPGMFGRKAASRFSGFKDKRMMMMMDLPEEMYFDYPDFYGDGNLTETNFSNMFKRLKDSPERREWKYWFEMFRPFRNVDPELPFLCLKMLTPQELIEFLQSSSYSKLFDLESILNIVHGNIESSKTDQPEVCANVSKALLEHLKNNPRKDIDSRKRNVGEVAASGLGQTTRTLNLLSPETSPEELEAVMNMLQVYLLFLNDAVDCTSDDAEENIERYLNSLNSTMNNLSSAFSKHGQTTPDDANTLSCTELKQWEKLFELATDTPTRKGKVLDLIIKKFCSLLERRLDQVSEKFILKACCQEYLEHESMNKTVFERAAKSSHLLLKRECSELLQGTQTTNVGKLLNGALDQVRKVTDSPLKFVTLIIEMENFILIWNDMKLLSEENSSFLKGAVESLENLISSLQTESATFSQFNLINDSKEKVLDLCDLSAGLREKKQILPIVLEKRQKEIDEHKKFTEHLRQLWGIVEDATAERDKRAVKSWLDRDSQKLSFAEEFQSGSLQCPTIEEEFQKLLVPYQTLKERQIFSSVFEGQLRTSKNKSLKKIAEMFARCKENFSSTVAKFEKGTMVVSELLELKSNSFNQNEAQLIEEVQQLIPAKTFKIRKQQIEMGMKAKIYQTCAEVMWKLKEHHKLTASFSDLDTIRELEISSLELKNIDDNLLYKSRDLKFVDSDSQVACLEEYWQCKISLIWVSKDVPKDDINRFASVLLNNAEDDKYVEKINCLVNALVGYAPLVYGLQETDCDQTTFFRLCKEVLVDQLGNRPDLAQDLREVGNSPEWIENALKSVSAKQETLVMERITRFNDHGRYEIGKVYTDRPEKSLDDVLKLSWIRSSNNNQLEHKDWTFSDLKELQSEVALMSSNLKDDSTEYIERFEALKDATENLGQAYLDLKKEGCMLFEDMFITINCPVEERVGIEVTLKALQTKKKVFGRSEENDKPVDVIKHCTDLLDFLKNCRTVWADSVRFYRRTYPELNYFNMGQLRTLRKELKEFEETGDKVYLKQSLPLLKLIGDLDSIDLKTFLKDSEAELKSVEEAEKKNQNRSSEQEADEKYEALDEEDKKHINYLMSEHIVSKELAMKAFPECHGREGNSRDYRKWFKAEEKRRDKSKTEEKANSQLMHDMTLEKVIDEPAGSGKEIRSFKGDLDAIWKRFEEYSSQGTKELISVKHLAYLLKNISVHSRPTYAMQEAKDLERGVPQLIAVAKEKTYQTVVTIYSDMEANQTLSRNEVFICSDATQLKEVEIFLNRVLKLSRSFYCMVNCHLLDTETCQRIQARLTNREENDDPNYGLVFIYDDRHTECRIRSFFNRHLIKKYESNSIEDVQKYTRRILSSQVDASKTVDPEGSSVRLLRSAKAGMGKSLQKENLRQKMEAKFKPGESEDIIIPIHKHLSTDAIIERLNRKLENGYIKSKYSTIHIDIAHEVEEGVDEFLFNLLILRSIQHSDGTVWQTQYNHYYIIECMPRVIRSEKGTRSVHEVLDLLPTTHCYSPLQIQEMYKRNSPLPDDTGVDKNRLMCAQWQKVLIYLECAERQRNLKESGPASSSNFKDLYSQKMPLRQLVDLPIKLLDDIHNHSYTQLKDKISSAKEALELLVKACGLADPSWRDLSHYVDFLYHHLQKVEENGFCSAGSVGTFPGFREFVIRFIFNMAQDFASRSLRVDEETPGETHDEVIPSEFSLKREWEKTNYPYLFINKDGQSFTSLGFYVEPNEKDKLSWDAVDERTGVILDSNCMSMSLKNDLEKNGINLSESFSSYGKEEQLRKLRAVMTVYSETHDPDGTYVVTIDNARKILAIYQRIQVGIPVIIMGETGCGKTMLIDFMSKLQLPRDWPLDTMVKVKVHGGTTEDDIEKEVRKAEQLAKDNYNKAEKYTKDHSLKEPLKVDTILFLDEANTTPAIGLVKEILCDGRCKGEPIEKSFGLKIIAACNPYRRHSDSMIEKLKKAGLGYYVEKDDEAKDRLRAIPMRNLVYRVQPLPKSLLPHVWNFGSLNSTSKPPDTEQTEAEDVGDNENSDNETEYIMSMVTIFRNAESNVSGVDLAYHTGHFARLATASQDFMRQRADECSFVSLRDVQRLLDLSSWFYGKRDLLFNEIDELEKQLHDGDLMPSKVGRNTENDVARSIVLALAVCYLARLEEKTRQEFAAHVADRLEDLWSLSHMKGETPPSESADKFMFRQHALCEIVFTKAILKHRNYKGIADNKALRENIYMMIVCIENKLPLFVIGKPGSSKSLAKAMVSDSMKGKSSYDSLFRELKEIYMDSFQCSRHATAENVENAFEQSADVQIRQEKHKSFVSVIVLEEIGLAEDSEKMPLKALHSLLEEGSYGKDKKSKVKLAFIGISNWALDPAKMNRGIFVQRDTPDETELLQIANTIIKGSTKKVKKFMGALTKGYRDIYKKEKPLLKKTKEFYGLRDFYSLNKMVGFGQFQEVGFHQVQYSIRRNFGGFNWHRFDPMKTFDIKGIRDIHTTDMPPSTFSGVIKSSLEGQYNPPETESRYLLIMTEGLGVLDFILDTFSKNKNQKLVVIFGSRFRDDVSYTKICHDINKIKTCMSNGTPVVLLNREELYESLYDALNQYFIPVKEQKFVNIGLGFKKVLTKVHKDFRLIVVADKDKVDNEYPIPLINRLEKHYLSALSLLSEEQCAVVEKLKKWAARFKSTTNQSESSEIERIFIGYCEEMLAVIVLQTTDETQSFNEREVLKRSQKKMLQCATGEAIARLDKAEFSETEVKKLTKIYTEQQHHELLVDYLDNEWDRTREPSTLIQVTTFATQMSQQDIQQIEKHMTQTKHVYIKDYFLTSFVKEEDFVASISSFYKDDSAVGEKVLIIQCEGADKNDELLDSVRYIIQEKSSAQPKVPTCTVLLLSFPRGQVFRGYQGSRWHCVHIDDPRMPEEGTMLPPLHKCMALSPSDLVDKTYRCRYKDSDERVDIWEFICGCLPLALSLVTEDQPNDRKEALQKLMNGKNEFSKHFLDILESLLTDEESKQWVRDKAANLSRLKETETLRQSMADSLREILAPPIAAIISFIDVRSNLNTLLEPEGVLTDIWLRIFKSSIKAIKQQNSFVIPTSGTKNFESLYPFSWLVKGTIDTIIESTKQHMNADPDDIKTKFHSKHYLGEIVMDSQYDTSSSIILEAYLHDFVSMSHHYTTLSEHKIVGKAIFHYIQRSCVSAPHLVHIHICYERLLPTFKKLSVVLGYLFDSEAERLSFHSKVKSQLDDPDYKDTSCDLIALHTLFGMLKEQSNEIDYIQSSSHKWVQSVNKCKQIVGKVLEASTDPHSDDTDSSECRNKWLHLLTKQAYIENVIVPTKKEDVYELCHIRDFSRELTEVEEDGWQTVDAYRKIVKFLSGTIIEGFQPLLDEDECPKCTKELTFPVLLECSHALCYECFSKLGSDRTCSVSDCSEEITAIRDYDAHENSKEKVAKFRSLRRRLSRFFMNFMADIVYEEGLEPEEEILEELINDVIMSKHSSASSREENLFNSEIAVEPTPTVRSFLLRHIRQSKHAKLAAELIGDKLLSSSPDTETLTVLMSLFEIHGCDSVDDLTGNLLECTEAFNKAQTVNSLKQIEKLVYAQTIISHLVSLLIAPGFNSTTGIGGKLERCLKATKTEQAWLLAARQVVSRKGIWYAKSIETNLQFLIPDKLQAKMKSWSVPKVYSLVGKNEAEFKELLKEMDDLMKRKVPPSNTPTTPASASAADGGSSTPVGGDNALSGSSGDDIMADFRRDLSTLVKKCVSDGMLLYILYETTMKGTKLHNLDLLKETISTSQSALCRIAVAIIDGVFLKGTKTCRDELLMMLVLHLVTCLNSTPSGNSPDTSKSILYPLAIILDNIDQVKGCLLPAMCTLPAVASPTASTPASHSATTKQTTPPKQEKSYGHTLGEACTTGGATKLRKLSSLSCAVLRCLTHLSLYAAALLDEAKVREIIQPPLANNKAVKTFFSEHIYKDLHTISECCGESEDDCIFLLYDVVAAMSKIFGEPYSKDLTNEKNRTEWERVAYVNFIKPVFYKRNDKQQDLSAWKLRSGIKVTDILNEPSTSSGVLEYPEIWRYRRPLTLESLRNRIEFDSTVQAQCVSLKSLLDNYETLRLVHHLPHIIKLVFALRDTLNGKSENYSRAEAKKLKVSQMSEYRTLKLYFDSFIKCWNETRCMNHEARKKLSNDNMLIEFLVDPHEREKQISYLLINDLVEAHNEVKSISVSTEHCGSIQLADVSELSLVNIRSEADLLNLISSYDGGYGDYNWREINAQVIAKYLSNKPEIEFTVDQLPFYHFPEDSDLYNRLRSVEYTQELLTENMQDYMSKQLERNVVNHKVDNRLQTLTSYIKELTIVINFISVLPSFDEDEVLSDYICKMLGKESSNPLTNDIHLKHVRHVWLLVKYEQAHQIMTNKQKPFDEVNLKPTSKPPTSSIDGSTSLHGFKTKVFLYILLEFIFLRLNRVTVKELGMPSDDSLHAALTTYLNTEYKGDRRQADRQRLLSNLPELSSDVKVEHATAVWCYTWKRFTGY